MPRFYQWLALAGLALAGLASAPFSHAGPDSAPFKGRMTMAFTKTKPGPNLAIPPLDAAQPARTATATFALG